ncbi:hypothetical protein ACWGID_04205 [Kribbella sp. NPDC054772]
MSSEPNGELVNILWVGGPAAAGKTTVSRLLARKHGLFWYSLDAYAFDHEQRAAAAGLHVMGTGPGNFDRRPMIIEDIRSLALNTAVLVEGAGVTPAMAGVAGNAVWLMPSKAEQSARLERRHPTGVHEGYIMGWDLVRSQLAPTRATVLVVDGQTVDQTIRAVEQHFRTFLTDLPAARSIDERQALTRLSNLRIATQAIQRPRSGRAKTTGHLAVHVFDCECAQNGCQEFVEVAVGDIPAAVTQAPPSITAPEHSSGT